MGMRVNLMMHLIYCQSLRKISAMSLLRILIFFILVTQIQYSQWTNQNPVPDGNDLWSTFFVDNNLGWIIGSEGFIKKTTNAGIEWVQQNSGTSLILKSIYFVNQSTGWICGESGTILKTTDGGQTWFNQTSGTTNHLTKIQFIDNEIGYVVGFEGTILKTIDGGSTWRYQSSNTNSDLYDVNFVDASAGYAVGGECGSYAILKTTNGGSSWSNKHSSFYYDYSSLLAVKFLNADTGFIGGGYTNQNIIFKTTDGGDTWIQLIITPSFKKNEKRFIEQTNIYITGGINSIYFKNKNIGYAVGGNGYGWDRQIYTTSDGGSTWFRRYSGWEENGLVSVSGNDHGQGWAVGFTGAIFITEDDGNSWLQILSGDKSSNYNGDDIYSIFCLNENIIWAVGKRNRWLPSAGDVILKTTNGGKIWKTQQFFQGSDGATKSVYFVNENMGWTVGDGMTGFYRTTDGGENWIAGVGLYSSVFFIDQNIGWTTNDEYNTGIFKSTDGGITWIQKSSVSSSSVYFNDINTGWAIGKAGSILKSTDAGETWVSKTSGTTNDLNYIKFYDSILGMCVGNNGTVLVSTDAGESWVTLNCGSLNDLQAVTFTNSNTIWICGDNGTILNTTDFGNSWILYDDVTENDLTSLCFTNETTGWIGGMNGTMFKYQNDIIPVELISFTANASNNEVYLEWITGTEINNYGFEIERYVDAENWITVGFVSGQGNSSLPNSYSFTDKNIAGVSKLKYRLKQLDMNGSYEYSNEIEVDITPDKFVLHQNYPNPFNPTTKIRYQLPIESRVVIKIYDILGTEILTLLNTKQGSGVYEIEFNANSLTSGVYVYRITASDPSENSGTAFVETKKMILIR